MRHDLIPKTLPSFIGLFLRPYVTQFIILMCISILAGTLAPLETILLRFSVDNLSHISFFTGEGTVDSIAFKLAALYGIWWLGAGMLWRVYDYLYLRIFPSLEADITRDLFEYTQLHEHRYFQNSFSGGIAHKITQMADNTCKILHIFADKLVRKVCTVTFTFITMYHIHPKVGLIFLVWISTLIILNVFFAPYVNYYSVELAHSKIGVFGKLVDSIANIINVKLFSANSYEGNYIKKSLDGACKADEELQFFLLKLRALEAALCAGNISFMILVLSRFYAQKIVTLGDIALVVTLSVAVAEHIWMLTQELGEFEKCLGECDQALETIARPHAMTDVFGAQPLKITQGVIEFKNVSFNHSESNTLFDDLSVKILPRQKVGLVGFSGSGKTSFINLIIRLFDLDSGEILIDGQNIAHVTQDSLRKNIGVIPQNPQLFHRSILENIRYANPSASDEMVIKAAQQAFAHDFISKSECGYNTLAGERGIKLSGGQVQRIAIARAILKNAPILILDEATSALDSLTEHHIQESFNLLMKDKTSLVIAHRISTLLDMDRILVFSKGKIVEDGNHNDLLMLNKVYAKLWNSQVNGFLTHNE